MSWKPAIHSLNEQENLPMRIYRCQETCEMLETSYGQALPSVYVTQMV